MDTVLNQQKQNQIILEGGKEYYYAINPFEMTNVFGAAVATLQEYSISGLNGENYKIYKTKEGNWYDIAEVNSGRDNLVLISLKSAIDLKESKNQHFL